MISLRDLNNFKLEDSPGSLPYGCSQEWYGSKWKRMAGCGPSVASNLLLYAHRSKRIDLQMELNHKADCLKLMDTVWKYVTPSFKGVHTLERFYKGVHRYAKTKGLEFSEFSLCIPKKASMRPEFSRVADFIKQALELDCPVAFLNLSNGMVKHLDSWHWVTIVSVRIEEQCGDVFVQVYDGDTSFEVDLKLWYETTTIGGGFVYFK